MAEWNHDVKRNIEIIIWILDIFLYQATGHGY